ncbi:hypothetical protein E0H70_28110 [Rhizobium leguminosarum bv. viciae]|nr:hypothetical protein E0H70_28110 [Rhizobium leguminosarum bv. viciae]
MTATLRLRMDAPGSTSRYGGHGTAITVRQVADLDGQYPEDPFETAVIAGNETIGVPVRPGRYRLEARLPGGNILRETVLVGRDKSEYVTFDAPPSAREWLSWQTLSGNVAPRDAYHERQSDWRGYNTLDLREQFLDWQYPRVRFMTAECSMSGIDQRYPFFADERNESDGLVSLWRVNFRREPLWQPFRAVALLDLEQRHAAEYIRFVAFLPVPWNSDYGDDAELELLLDPTRGAGRELRVSVVDEKRSALLSYLGTSQMREAAVAFDAYGLTEQIQFDMEAKRRNPLAAAAAAYVGLSFPVGDERRETWSPWLRNLMNWFPEIPDGAILAARDMMDRARTRDDLRDALSAFREAYRRGPPYFSAGVRLLLEGLTLFLHHSRDYGISRDTIRRMHREVSNLALMTDPTQAFTVLKVNRRFFDV